MVEELLELEGKEVKKNWVYKIGKWLVNTQVSTYETTEETNCDALCDIIVVSVGAIEKLGYNSRKAMVQTLMEINSRTGSINPETKKFEKLKTKEAMDKWYKSDYKSCLR